MLESTRDVGLIYGVIGGLTLLIPLAFAFTAVGRAEQYLPARAQPASPAGPVA